MTDGDPTPVVQRVEQELRSANLWWILFRVLHDWLSGLSMAASVGVFLLGTLLLYMPEQDRLATSRWIAILSGLGLIFQLITSTQRLRERATRKRMVAAALDGALTAFRAGLLPLEKLNQVLGHSLKELANEESA